MAMPFRNTNRTRRNRLLSGRAKYRAAMVVLLLVLGLFFLVKPDKDSNKLTPASTSIEQTSNTPGNSSKPSTVAKNGSTTPSTSTADKRSVTPVITYAGQSEAGGTVVINSFVPGVFENTGTCSAKLTMGDNNATASSAGSQNVSYTNCAPMQIARNKFASAGQWTLVVSYSSPDANGSSTARSVEVR